MMEGRGDEGKKRGREWGRECLQMGTKYIVSCPINRFFPTVYTLTVSYFSSLSFVLLLWLLFFNINYSKMLCIFFPFLAYTIQTALSW